MAKLDREVGEVRRKLQELEDLKDDFGDKLQARLAEMDAKHSGLMADLL